LQKSEMERLKNSGGRPGSGLKKKRLKGGEQVMSPRLVNRSTRSTMYQTHMLRTHYSETNTLTEKDSLGGEMYKGGKG